MQVKTQQHPYKWLSRLALILALCCCVLPAFAQEIKEDVQMDPQGNMNLDRPQKTMDMYLKKHPEARVIASDTFPNGMIHYGDQGAVAPFVQAGINPGTVWPEITPPLPVFGSDHVKARLSEMNNITHYQDPMIGPYPLTANFAATASAVAGLMESDVEQSPEMATDRAKEEQNQANQSSADMNANVERMNAGAAIDYIATYMYNFTVDEGNKWNQVRNQLFIPMAILIMLPGAILSQIKAIVTQGLPVVAAADPVSSPFEGIMRSVVAIFMIPGTYLVVNYGIDVSNSITYTIASEYTRIFGTNMYQDAMCAHQRAFPVRDLAENKGFIPDQTANMGILGNPQGIAPGSKPTPFAIFEGNNLEIKLQDKCAGLYIDPEDRANEMVSYEVNSQRNAYNTINAGLAMSWNVMCAFQVCYLYYLWFAGPVVAGLWTYPVPQLRNALPNWCFGVVVVCLWSLFWNTVVLLMACLRGVDETGTMMMSALNFLATASVKNAFDFVSLAKSAGDQISQQTQQAAKASSGGGGGGSSGAKGAAGAAGAPGAGANPAAMAARQQVVQQGLGLTGPTAGGAATGAATHSLSLGGGAGTDGVPGHTPLVQASKMGGIPGVVPHGVSAPPNSHVAAFSPGVMGGGNMPWTGGGAGGAAGASDGSDGAAGAAGASGAGSIDPKTGALLDANGQLAAFHNTQLNAGDQFSTSHSPVHLSASQLHNLLHNGPGAAQTAQQIAAAGGATLPTNQPDTNMFISAQDLASNNFGDAGSMVDFGDTNVAVDSPDNVTVGGAVGGGASPAGGSMSVTPPLTAGGAAGPSPAQMALMSGAAAGAVPMTGGTSGSSEAAATARQHAQEAMQGKLADVQHAKEAAMQQAAQYQHSVMAGMASAQQGGGVPDQTAINNMYNSSAAQQMAAYQQYLNQGGAGGVAGGVNSSDPGTSVTAGLAKEMSDTLNPVAGLAGSNSVTNDIDTNFSIASLSPTLPNTGGTFSGTPGTTGYSQQAPGSTGSVFNLDLGGGAPGSSPTFGQMMAGNFDGHAKNFEQNVTAPDARISTGQTFGKDAGSLHDAMTGHASTVQHPPSGQAPVSGGGAGAVPTGPSMVAFNAPAAPTADQARAVQAGGTGTGGNPPSNDILAKEAKATADQLLQLPDGRSGAPNSTGDVTIPSTGTTGGSDFARSTPGGISSEGVQVASADPTFIPKAVADAVNAQQAPATTGYSAAAAGGTASTVGGSSEQQTGKNFGEYLASHFAAKDSAYRDGVTAPDARIASGMNSSVENLGKHSALGDAMSGHVSSVPGAPHAAGAPQHQTGTAGQHFVPAAQAPASGGTINVPGASAPGAQNIAGNQQTGGGSGTPTAGDMLKREAANQMGDTLLQLPDGKSASSTTGGSTIPGATGAVGGSDLARNSVPVNTPVGPTVGSNNVADDGAPGAPGAAATPVTVAGQPAAPAGPSTFASNAAPAAANLGASSVLGAPDDQSKGKNFGDHLAQNLGGKVKDWEQNVTAPDARVANTGMTLGKDAGSLHDAMTGTASGVPQTGAPHTVQHGPGATPSGAAHAPGGSFMVASNGPVSPPTPAAGAPVAGAPGTTGTPAAQTPAGTRSEANNFLAREQAQATADQLLQMPDGKSATPGTTGGSTIPGATGAISGGDLARGSVPMASPVGPTVGGNDVRVDSNDTSGPAPGQVAGQSASVAGQPGTVSGQPAPAQMQPTGFASNAAPTGSNLGASSVLGSPTSDEQGKGNKFGDMLAQNLGGKAKDWEQNVTAADARVANTGMTLGKDAGSLHDAMTGNASGVPQTGTPHPVQHVPGQSHGPAGASHAPSGSMTVASNTPIPGTSHPAPAAGGQIVQGTPAAGGTASGAPIAGAPPAGTRSGADAGNFLAREQAKATADQLLQMPDGKSATPGTTGGSTIPGAAGAIGGELARGSVSGSSVGPAVSGDGVRIASSDSGSPVPSTSGSGDVRIASNDTGSPVPSGQSTTTSYSSQAAPDVTNVSSTAAGAVGASAASSIFGGQNAGTDDQQGKGGKNFGQMVSDNLHDKGKQFENNVTSADPRAKNTGFELGRSSSLNDAMTGSISSVPQTGSPASAAPGGPVPGQGMPSSGSSMHVAGNNLAAGQHSGPAGHAPGAAAPGQHIQQQGAPAPGQHVQHQQVVNAAQPPQAGQQPGAAQIPGTGKPAGIGSNDVLSRQAAEMGDTLLQMPDGKSAPAGTTGNTTIPSTGIAGVSDFARNSSAAAAGAASAASAAAASAAAAGAAGIPTAGIPGSNPTAGSPADSGSATGPAVANSNVSNDAGTAYALQAPGSAGSPSNAGPAGSASSNTSSTSFIAGGAPTGGTSAAGTPMPAGAGEKVSNDFRGQLQSEMEKRAQKWEHDVTNAGAKDVVSSMRKDAPERAHGSLQDSVTGNASAPPPQSQGKGSESTGAASTWSVQANSGTGHSSGTSHGAGSGHVAATSHSAGHIPGTSHGAGTGHGAAPGQAIPGSASPVPGSTDSRQLSKEQAGQHIVQQGQPNAQQNGLPRGQQPGQQQGLNAASELKRDQVNKLADVLSSGMPDGVSASPSAVSNNLPTSGTDTTIGSNQLSSAAAQAAATAGTVPLSGSAIGAGSAPSVTGAPVPGVDAAYVVPRTQDKQASGSTADGGMQTNPAYGSATGAPAYGSGDSTTYGSAAYGSTVSGVTGSGTPQQPNQQHQVTYTAGTPQSAEAAGMARTSAGELIPTAGDMVADKYDQWEQRVTDSSADVHRQMTEHNQYHQSLGDQIQHNVTHVAPPSASGTQQQQTSVPAPSAFTQALGSAASGQGQVSQVTQSTPPAPAPAQPGQPLQSMQPAQPMQPLQPAQPTPTNGFANPPQPSKFGSLANSREDALNLVTGHGQHGPAGAAHSTHNSSTTNKMIVTGAAGAAAAKSATGKGNAKGDAGKPASKLGSALGRAATNSTPPTTPGSRKDGKGGEQPPKSGDAPKKVQDPMGSVASGTTLRRWRMKRKASAAEIQAMEKLGGNDMTVE